MRRFPNRVYGSGNEPDPRFSLANERTFLAWIRTSLALSAAGVALAALPVPIGSRLRFAAAGLFILAGLCAAAQAWVGWARTESALRHDSTLPGPSLAAVITLGVLIGGVLVGIGLLA